jgi:hypothetical protein
MKNNPDFLGKMIEAEQLAFRLFDAIESKGLIRADIFEKDLNQEILTLCKSLLKTDKFWHKRIVRAGENTLHPYRENPPNLKIKADDILFIDLGPVLENWEADVGRTYVLGNDKHKHKICEDAKTIWHFANEYYQNTPSIMASELYQFCQVHAQLRGWEFGGEIAGHILGVFPHENLEGLPKDVYVHAENNLLMHDLTKKKNVAWVIEVHLIDRQNKIGAFVEHLALPSQVRI